MTARTTPPPCLVFPTTWSQRDRQREFHLFSQIREDCLQANVRSWLILISPGTDEFIKNTGFGQVLTGLYQILNFSRMVVFAILTVSSILFSRIFIPSYTESQENWMPAKQNQSALMSQLIHVEVVKLWESEGSKVDDDAFTGNLQFFNKSKGSYSEALSVAIKIVL